MGLGGRPPDGAVTRTFVDIGSHEGQTLAEVTKERWGFDRIHAIEPMPRQMTYLRAFYGSDPRIALHDWALHDHAGWTTIYGSNALLEASLYPDKVDVDERVRTVVRCVDAAAFFAALSGEVVVNLNAEGAERPILDRLLETGEIARISALLVSFDIRKIASQAKEETRLRAALDRAGVNWTCEYVEALTHQEQSAAWLA